MLWVVLAAVAGLLVGFRAGRVVERRGDPIPPHLPRPVHPAMRAPLQPKEPPYEQL